jgi:hypothetical protein
MPDRDVPITAFRSPNRRDESRVLRSSLWSSSPGSFKRPVRMIVNSENNHNNMVRLLIIMSALFWLFFQLKVPQENPPSYDAVESIKPRTLQNSLAPVSDYLWSIPDTDDPNKTRPLPVLATGPSYVPSPSTSATVYNYVNPRTGEHVVSLLPPDHPEMICLQAGEHIRETQFGLFGEIGLILIHVIL